VELTGQDRQTERKDDDAGARDRHDEESRAAYEDAEPSYRDGDPAQPHGGGPGLRSAAHPSFRGRASLDLHRRSTDTIPSSMTMPRVCHDLAWAPLKTTIQRSRSAGVALGQNLGAQAVLAPASWR
jgi:hypothetical protein